MSALSIVGRLLVLALRDRRTHPAFKRVARAALRQLIKHVRIDLDMRHR